MIGKHKCPKCGGRNTTRFQWVDNPYWEYWICWDCEGGTLAGDTVFVIKKEDK